MRARWTEMPLPLSMQTYLPASESLSPVSCTQATSFTRGDLSGPEAMDSVCQVHADGAVLGGEWTAWVSTESVDAIDRIVGDGPWVRMDGELLFLNRAKLALTPEHSISLDEYLVSQAGEQAWTGTTLGGIYGGDDCQGFATASEEVRGIIGNTSYTNSYWTDDRTQFGFDRCGFQARLYCFEQ